jgi:hypothetical protein
MDVRYKCSDLFLETAELVFESFGAPPIIVQIVIVVIVRASVVGGGDQVRMTASFNVGVGVVGTRKLPMIMLAIIV